MIGLIAALMLTQSSPATDLRLEAFKTACVPHRQDLVRAAEALAADGWARVPDEDHPELATTMARARAEAVDPELSMTADFSVWGRTVQDRRLYVVLNRADAVIGKTEDSDGDGELQYWERETVFTMLGCGLWDFDATAPIDLAAMTAWVGAEPVQFVDAPGQISGGTWNVFHMMPGTAEVHMGFIPNGGGVALGLGTGFSGVSITMSSGLPEEDEAEVE